MGDDRRGVIEAFVHRGTESDEARRFVRLMRIKTELRRMRVLGCEASRRGVTLHLRDDAPLDVAKLTALVAKKGSPYKLTPDMRLTRKMTEHDDVADGLDATDKMLVELAACAKSPAARALTCGSRAKVQ